MKSTLLNPSAENNADDDDESSSSGEGVGCKCNVSSSGSDIIGDMDMPRAPEWRRKGECDEEASSPLAGIPCDLPFGWVGILHWSSF